MHWTMCDAIWFPVLYCQFHLFDQDLHHRLACFPSWYYHRVHDDPPYSSSLLPSSMHGYHLLPGITSPSLHYHTVRRVDLPVEHRCSVQINRLLASDLSQLTKYHLGLFLRCGWWQLLLEVEPPHLPASCPSIRIDQGLVSSSSSCNQVAFLQCHLPQAARIPYHGSAS
jgi:hypothetical protein